MNYIFQHKQVQSSFGSFFVEIAQPNSSMFELKSHLLINAKNTQTLARPRKSHQHKDPVRIILPSTSWTSHRHKGTNICARVLWTLEFLKVIFAYSIFRGPLIPRTFKQTNFAKSLKTVMLLQTVFINNKLCVWWRQKYLVIT